MNKKKKILITGAGGMVGRYIIEFFFKKGWDVVALYALGEDAVDTEHTSKIIRGDISSKTFPREINREVDEVDSIIHCAAITNVNQCEENKKLCNDTNVLGTKNMTELAKNWNAGLIFFSTPMVFSGKKGNYKESDKTEPVNLYGNTKVAGEDIVSIYKKGLVLRLNPIGIRPVGAYPSFIQWFFEAARDSKSFTLFSDVLINPISTKTLAELLKEFIENGETGIFHVGSSDIANKADIWDMIVKEFPKFSGNVLKAPVKESHAGGIAKRPEKMWLSVSKVQTLGYLMPKWRSEVSIVLKELR